MNLKKKSFLIFETGGSTMNEEMKVTKENDVWELVSHRKEQKAIGVKKVYMTKKKKNVKGKLKYTRQD